MTKKAVHPLVNALELVTDEGDAAIRLLPAEALGVTGYSRFTALPQDLAYRVWSEGERRWIGMTFYENQAWLARPDLDPVEFGSHQVTL